MSRLPCRREWRYTKVVAHAETIVMRLYRTQCRLYRDGMRTHIGSTITGGALLSAVRGPSKTEHNGVDCTRKKQDFAATRGLPYLQPKHKKYTQHSNDSMGSARRNIAGDSPRSMVCNNCNLNNAAPSGAANRPQLELIE